MIDFTLSPEIKEMRRKVKTLVDEQVIPNEGVLSEHNAESDAMMKDLQRQAKAMGLWAMFIGPEAGGTGKGFLPYAFVNEILGRSPYAPRAFGCAALLGACHPGNAFVQRRSGIDNLDRHMAQRNRI